MFHCMQTLVATWWLISKEVGHRVPREFSCPPPLSVHSNEYLLLLIRYVHNLQAYEHLMWDGKYNCLEKRELQNLIQIRHQLYGAVCLPNLFFPVSQHFPNKLWPISLSWPKTSIQMSHTTANICSSNFQHRWKISLARLFKNYQFRQGFPAFDGALKKVIISEV